MTLLTDREAQQATSRRDAQAITPWEVRFTDVKAWAEALEKHVDRGLIEDNEVWFSITAGIASLDQVEGKPSPGGHREVPYFASRYVEASYVARGKLHKLSVYCGCSWVREAPTETAQRLKAGMVQECADNVQAAVRAVSVALSKHHDQLEVNSGAALHLHNMDDGPWVAFPGTTIEAPPAETCGVCGVAIYHANEHWRDESGRFEVVVDMGFRPGTRMRRTKLDHVHGPAGVAI